MPLQDMYQSKIVQDFMEHDRRMKLFRKSHPSPLRVKLSRRVLINKLWPSLILDMLKEAGGTRFQNSPAGLSTCASMSILALLILHPGYGQLNQS